MQFKFDQGLSEHFPDLPASLLGPSHIRELLHHFLDLIVLLEELVYLFNTRTASLCDTLLARCIQKLWGKKRIVSHLYTKGFDQKAVANALDELQNVDYVENCKRLLLRDHKRQIAAIKEDSSQLSKLIASLYRMGYSFSEIKSAVADILNE